MSTPRLVRFGVFEMDLRTRELRRRGVRISLQDQAFQVLALLVERAGDLVTRDEFRERLWPDDVFVDFEHGLNKAVVKVRHAIGDRAESPRFVETLARRGYRFIAPVEFADVPFADPAAPAAALAFRAAASRLVYDGRSVSLRVGANVLGRDPDAVVSIDSPKASRHHAMVTITSDGAVLRDLGSKNGTSVNGKPVTTPVALSDGDQILIGPARLVFRGAPRLGSTQTDTDD